MFTIVLFEPEIPPNTGNIIRLCANIGAQLHLVKPLGFSLQDKHLIRAGMDYRELVAITIHTDWSACRQALSGRRMFAFSTHGIRRYDEYRFSQGDVFVFGPETRGLPQAVLENFPKENLIRVPMLAQSRSLNLSNAVAVVMYEAWRQTGFPGGI